MPMPIDSFMTEEQIAIQKLAHEIAEYEIRPIAMELDHKTDPAEAAFMPHLLQHDAQRRRHHHEEA